MWIGILSLTNELSEYSLSSLVELLLPSLVTIGIAIFGFCLWKKQFKLQQVFTYSKDLLSELKKVKRKIDFFRNSLEFAYDLAIALKDEKQVVNRSNWEFYRARGNLVKQKLDDIETSYTEMLNTKYILEIILDTKLDFLFTNLNKCMDKFKSNLQLYILNENELACGRSSIINSDIEKEIQEIFSSHSWINLGKESDFDRNLENSFREIEEGLVDYIGLKQGFFHK